jgi:hypothetical protein
MGVMGIRKAWDVRGEIVRWGGRKIFGRIGKGQVPVFGSSVQSSENAEVHLVHQSFLYMFVGL